MSQLLSHSLHHPRIGKVFDHYLWNILKDSGSVRALVEKAETDEEFELLGILGCGRFVPDDEHETNISTCFNGFPSKDEFLESLNIQWDELILFGLIDPYDFWKFMLTAKSRHGRKEFTIAREIIVCLVQNGLTMDFSAMMEAFGDCCKETMPVSLAVKIHGWETPIDTVLERALLLNPTRHETLLFLTISKILNRTE